MFHSTAHQQTAMLGCSQRGQQSQLCAHPMHSVLRSNVRHRLRRMAAMNQNARVSSDSTRFLNMGTLTRLARPRGQPYRQCVHTDASFIEVDAEDQISSAGSHRPSGMDKECAIPIIPIQSFCSRIGFAHERESGALKRTTAPRQLNVQHLVFSKVPGLLDISRPLVLIVFHLSRQRFEVRRVSQRCDTFADGKQFILVGRK